MAWQVYVLSQSCHTPLKGIGVYTGIGDNYCLICILISFLVFLLFAWSNAMMLAVHQGTMKHLSKGRWGLQLYLTQHVKHILDHVVRRYNVQAGYFRQFKSATMECLLRNDYSILVTSMTRKSTPIMILKLGLIELLSLSVQSRDMSK